VEAVNVNWTAVYNRLFKMIDGARDGRNYYSGPRFIEKIQEFKPECPHYSELISRRNLIGLSTNRRDYFKDLFLELSEEQRFQFVSEIISDTEAFSTADVMTFGN